MTLYGHVIYKTLNTVTRRVSSSSVDILSGLSRRPPRAAQPKASDLNKTRNLGQSPTWVRPAP